MSLTLMSVKGSQEKRIEKGPEEITEGPATCSKQSHLQQVSWVISLLGFEHMCNIFKSLITVTIK